MILRMAAFGVGLSLAAGAAWAQVGAGEVGFDPQQPATEAYRESIRTEDAKRAREAAEGGESFSPTFDRPTRPAPPAAVIPGGGAPEPEAPPPAAASAQSVERPPPGPRAAPPAAQYGERPPDRGRDMEASSPLDALLDVLAAPPAKAVWLDYERPQRAVEAAPGGGARAAGRALPESLAGLAVGQGLYARMLYEANSDWPGPVMLEILEPPLEGAVATGAFRTVRERLSIRIDRLSVGRESFAVAGWAVDPGCACYGIPGEVDRHWFERVLLPSAVAFAGGFLEAAARTARVVTQDPSGSSITVETGRPSHRQQVYAGAAAAARQAGSVLLESAPKGPTVRVPRNTELVFVVTELPGQPAQGQVPAEAAGERGRGEPPVAVIGDGGVSRRGVAGRGVPR